MINSVPKFDGTDYVEWSRSFNDILQISWPFLSKIVSRLKKPSNVDDIKAWDSANEHLLSVLRLTTPGAARSVLLQFEPK